ncbi:MAG TPA: N-acetyltransferase [Nitrososphaerales archaeon]
MLGMENLFIKGFRDYQIRQCAEDDIQNVVSINMVSLPEHYSDYFFEDLLRSSPESFLVAETNNLIVGYIMCRIEHGFSNFKRFNLSKKGHIVSVAILEPHRGKGLGEQMVKSARDALKIKGCSEAFLEVRVSNVGAVKLYQRLGFRIITTMEGYYRDNEPAHLMSLQIN